MEIGALLEQKQDIERHLREIEEKYQQQLEDSEALTEQNKSLDSSVARQQVQQRDRPLELVV